jgi:hypothetical protein
MSFNMKKILYIGCGLHIEPVTHFPDIKEFIFVDSNPRSPYDCSKFHIECYNNTFYDELLEKCLINNFTLTCKIKLDANYCKRKLSIYQKIFYSFKKINKLINPTLLVFINKLTGQKIKYYISTNILENMNNELKMDIEDSDGIIFQEFITDKKILEYFIRPKIFIGYSTNNYNLLNYEENTLMYFLNNNKCSISYYFNKYYLVEITIKKGSEIKIFDSFEDLKNVIKERIKI